MECKAASMESMPAAAAVLVSKSRVQESATAAGPISNTTHFPAVHA